MPSISAPQSTPSARANAQLLVLREPWNPPASRCLHSPGLVRDRLAGVVLPAVGGTVSLSVLGAPPLVFQVLHVEAEVDCDGERGEDSYEGAAIVGSLTTRVILFPAIPSTLPVWMPANQQERTSSQGLSRYEYPTVWAKLVSSVRAAAEPSALETLLGLPRPQVLLVAGDQGCGCAHAVALAAYEAKATLFRVNAADLFRRASSSQHLGEVLQRDITAVRDSQLRVVYVVESAHFLVGREGADEDHLAAFCNLIYGVRRWSQSGCPVNVCVVLSVTPSVHAVNRHLVDLVDTQIELPAMSTPADVLWCFRTALHEALRARFVVDASENDTAAGTERRTVDALVDQTFPDGPRSENVVSAGLGLMFADLWVATRRTAARAMPRGTDIKWDPEGFRVAVREALGAQSRALGVGMSELTGANQSSVGTLRVVLPPASSSASAPRTTIPDAPDRLGGLGDAFTLLHELVLWNSTRRADYKRLGVTPCVGALVYGPPGVGKTALVRAVAAECGAALVLADAATLARGEVGESERSLAAVYARASALSPAVVFIDEIDCLFGDASGSGDNDDDGASGVAGTASLGRLSYALTRAIDATAATAHDQQPASWRTDAAVVTIGATNAPWAVPRSVLRPGRLERLVHIGLPDAAQRREIARACLGDVGRASANNMRLEERERVCDWAASTDAAGASGADIAGALRQARLIARVAGSTCATAADVEHAFRRTGPSVPSRMALDIAQWKRRAAS